MAVAAQDALAPTAPRVEGVRAEAGTIAAMDGLRGLSVLWIVLFHYSVLRDAAADPWAAALRDTPGIASFVAHGPYAVDLFFLISGFLLTLPWIARAHHGAPAPDTRRFYVRRIRRIVPAYYLHLAVLFAGVMPLLHGMGWWRSDLYVYMLNAVAHALFVHNLSPLTSGSLGVNGALWTLAIEAQFYLLLPVLAPLFVRAPWRALAAATAVSAAWIAGSHHGFDALVRWHLEIGRHWHWDESSIRRLLAIQFPAYLAHFALGATMARLWFLHRDEASPQWRTVLFGASVGILAAIVAGWRPLGEWGWMVSLTALAGVVLAAALGAAFVLERGPLAFAGRISYSAYLWHLPLLLCLQARTAIDAAVFFAAYIAGVIAIGWLSWRGVEWPFMRGRERGSAVPPPSP